MNKTDIAQLRLINQQIVHSQFTHPSEVVSWMGAMQAQDYQMAKWAIGSRLPGATLETIEEAIERGDILRTHVLRPTWHFVSAGDFRWLTQLSATQIEARVRSRHQQLGLTREVTRKSNQVIETALAGGKQLTRKELVKVLVRAGFEDSNNRGSHLILRAELDGLICSGATTGRDYTYTLLDGRVPETPALNREASLEKLARIYFAGHGPATLEDFTWWSGLSITEARDTLESIAPDFLSEEVDSKSFWFSEPVSGAGDEQRTVSLLPAYDELLLGYKDRSASITPEAQTKAISNNGIFRPIIVVNGEVVGIWRHKTNKNSTTIKTTYFNKPGADVLELVETAARRFAEFLGRGLEISHQWE